MSHRDAIGVRFVALVEETVAAAQRSLSRAVS